MSLEVASSLTSSALLHQDLTVFRILGSRGKTCSSGLTSPNTLSQRARSGSGVSQAYSGSRSQSRSRWRLQCRDISTGSSTINGEDLVGTHSLPASSRKPFRAWKMLRLFIYWTSPFWKSKAARCFSAVKCRASSASACASVIGGMSADRG